MRISDETLMAYVDDELDPAEKLRVEAAARTDAALARRIQTQRRLREQMAGAFADLLKQPPPERLVEAARAPRGPAPVVDLSAVRAQRAAVAKPKPARWGWVSGVAVAACVVLAVGGAFQLAPRFGPRVGGEAGAPMVGGPAGDLVAQGALAGALDHQLSSAGAKPDDAVRLGVSFRSSEGRYCRTFQVQRGDGFAGLACRDPQGWRIRMTVANAVSATGPAYRQAATETPAPVLTAVDSLIQGAPLDAKQEAAAQAQGWR